jgi:hypothetical protein
VTRFPATQTLVVAVAVVLAGGPGAAQKPSSGVASPQASSKVASVTLRLDVATTMDFVRIAPGTFLPNGSRERLSRREASTPSGPPATGFYVVRGGSFDSIPGVTRSAQRSSGAFNLAVGRGQLGLRLVRVPTGQKK